MKRKKPKKLSMRKGMKVTVYGCKSDEKYIRGVCDLQENMKGAPCKDGCGICPWEEDGPQIAYTFQLVDKKILKLK